MKETVLQWDTPWYRRPTGSEVISVLYTEAVWGDMGRPGKRSIRSCAIWDAGGLVFLLLRFSPCVSVGGAAGARYPGFGVGR